MTDTSTTEHILGDIPLTPEEIERQIRDVADRLEKGAEVIQERHIALVEADRLLKREKADRYMVHRRAGMTIKDAECQTVLDTDPARHERDIAQVAYTYARDLYRSYENRLRALQTQSASIRAAYPMAGRGLDTPDTHRGRTRSP